MKTFSYACVLLGVASAFHGLRHRRDSSPLFYELPSNASLVLSGIQTGFDCGDLPYGYYADEANNCAIFHVCLPYIDHDIYITRQFSFMCVPGSYFDQQRLACTLPVDVLPCSHSTDYRKSNAYLGQDAVNFHEK